ncbi:YopT-type cysteine protease domain-containing protein [Pseudomonas sp. SB113]|uniref:YopT-type cysteine protease domain-containing protein n=1 Tax=Pseudomonas sp. SB113 TaxID=3154123 RepID=UPI00345C8D3C
MDGWLLHLCQKFDVEIVKDYEQDNDPAKLSYDLTKRGWCHGMTIDWLRCKRNSIDFWESFNSDSGKHRVRFLMARQNMINLKGTVADKKSKIQAGMSSAGLVLRTLEQDEGDIGQVSAADLVNSLLRVRGRYVCLAIYGLGGAHAMGILVSQTQFVFMDPNAGEFVFPKESVFRLWLSRYLTFMGYSSAGVLSYYSMYSFG